MRTMNIEDVKTYNEAVSYINAIPRFSGKNEMTDTVAFLDAVHIYLKNNQYETSEYKPKIIHVAGTNGKGSTCSYLTSIHRQMGYKTGTFTSPHLVDMVERIAIDGVSISHENFFSYFQIIRTILKGYNEARGTLYHPSFFEFIFFIAVVCFTVEAAQVQIWETGLGGRLDATNSLPDKDICIICEIGMDHMEYLGDTIASIAYEKAGIIREGVPVVAVSNNPQSLSVITDRANEVGAPLIVTPAIKNITYNKKNKGIDFSFESRYYNNATFYLKGGALYQVENATLAIAAVDELYKGACDTATIQRGLDAMIWPGRLEEVEDGVFYDGAHNVDGVNALIDSVSTDGCKGERLLLFSAVDDKQADVMLQNIADSKLFSLVATAHIDSSRGIKREKLEELISVCKSYAVYESVEEAIDALKRIRKKQDYIYVCGSLYMIGELKSRG